MRRLPVIFILVTMSTWSGTVQAQLFSRKSRPNPVQRVPELIVALKTDADERKRAAAADELRDYDVKAFPEIVPVLVDVAHTDAKPNVRLEALLSLSKIRPISAEAGRALEHAAAKDESWKVRTQAKTALWRYQLAGYSHKNQNMPQVVDRNGKSPMTTEPPLAETIIITPKAATPTPLPKVNATPIQPTAKETKKPASFTPEFRPASNPRPQGFSTAIPATPRIVDAGPPIVVTPPAQKSEPTPVSKDEGPNLIPPR